MIYNTSPVRHACKSCIPDFEEGKRYIWNREKTKLVPGYTQRELTKLKHAKMTPEEIAQDELKTKRDAEAAMLAFAGLSAWNIFPYRRFL